MLTSTSDFLPELLDTHWHRTSAAYICSCKRRLLIGITSQGKCASRSTWHCLPPFHPPSCKNDIYFYTKSVFSEPAFPLLNLPVCSVFSSFVTGSSLFYWLWSWPKDVKIYASERIVPHLATDVDRFGAGTC